MGILFIPLIYPTVNGECQCVTCAVITVTGFMVYITPCAVSGFQTHDSYPVLYLVYIHVHVHEQTPGRGTHSTAHMVETHNGLCAT